MKKRDLVTGTVENAADCDIIQKRCKKVLAIFSPTFFKSKEIKFLTDFANHVETIQGADCKLIPLIFSPLGIRIDIPLQFYNYTKIAYKPGDKMANFWEKLIQQNLGFNGPLQKELTEYEDYIIGGNEIQAVNRIQLNLPKNQGSSSANGAELIVNNSISKHSRFKKLLRCF